MLGLFGAVNVQPYGALWFRSQVTAADLKLATTGQTDLGQPLIDYDAKYTDGPLKGRPILKMLNDENQIVHTDLTAIITGPGRGNFDNSETNPAYPDRGKSYREITAIYHDDYTTSQSFDIFARDTNANKGLQQALTAGQDLFGINYGMGAIGAPIWANRIEVGPNYACAACRYEEFFLSSWPLGDPAMIVDIPANATNATSNGEPVKGPKATQAYYPDDPSNVYHSYIGDHTKYRILHAGTDITHVHHQHAHQWLHSPNSPDGNYRDSQMITPGSAFNLDYVYNGSGNKNHTVGDSIFHCHFYPHFAQGMWSLWRVHDTFEAGTNLDESGKPLTDGWNRVLPDGEIVTGTPTPAIVPIPSYAMAPMPAKVRVCPAYGAESVAQRVGESCPAAPSADATPVGHMVVVSEEDLKAGKNPGYPFYIPGVSGHRAPHPPLDFACAGGVETVHENGLDIPRCIGEDYHDGGLPRHVVLAEEGDLYEKHNRWDFTKTNDRLLAIQLSEEGTLPEQAGMKANAQRIHPSFTPEGSAANFILNGQQPQQGAPYADPAINLDGTPILKPDGSNKLVYKAANIQLDVVFNKKGWHFPQQRMISLWGDVQPTIDGKRKPEPFFFRANSFDVVEYWHTNLMPNYYDLDDFQVRTPTDVLGQHIHLVKFDVTSSDGAANGFNYEDGTFSPQEVQEQVGAIQKNGGLYSHDGSKQNQLTLKTIPFFGEGPPNQDDPEYGKPQWLGAQATIQRWYADPLCNDTGAQGDSPCKQDPGVNTEDRTIRTVFTHDHFGPSTHQQAGLYAGLVIEPYGSEWKLVDGTKMGGREVPGPGGATTSDGGPTKWEAMIIPPTASGQKPYREFMLEFQDKTLAYTASSKKEKTPYQEYDSEEPPTDYWGWADPDHVVRAPPNFAVNKNPAPNPYLVSTSESTGSWSVNYTNEPLPFRVASAEAGHPEQSDLGEAFVSMTRADEALNVQPTAGTPISEGSPFKFPPPFAGAEPTDPYTPLLRAYPGEQVQVRTLVGAHEMPHAFTMHGLNWLFEPANRNSGFRSTQGMGISEYYEFIFEVPRVTQDTAEVADTTDYLYAPSSGVDGVEFGNWGILRSYKTEQHDLPPLPHQPINTTAVPVCPTGAPKRSFELAAVYAGPSGTTGVYDLLKEPMLYNSRGKAGKPAQKIINRYSMMYVYNNDLETVGDTLQLKADAPIEPVVIRANAGDCIEVTLHNKLPDFQLNRGLSVGENAFCDKTDSTCAGVTLQTSKQVGLHPQLLTLDMNQSNGVNVGSNQIQTADIGESVTYQWYAGNVECNEAAECTHTPVEFGSVPLTPADPLMQHNFGMIGALIVEPEGATWTEDVNTRAQATVKVGGTSFREFVLMLQDDVADLKYGELVNNGNTGTKKPTNVQVPNSRSTQAVNYRTEPLAYRYGESNFLTSTSIAQALSNSQVSGDPETPVFAAAAGEPARIRLLHPAGQNDQSMTIHGHLWQELPYTDNSTRIGDNPESEWLGGRTSFVPNSSFEVVIDSAGGVAAAKGDYLYRAFVGKDFQNGIWGVMRVGDKDADTVTITRFDETGVFDRNTVNLATGQMADTVKVRLKGEAEAVVKVDMMTGKWGLKKANPPTEVLVVSSHGGKKVAKGYTGALIRPTDASKAKNPKTHIPPRINEEQFRAKARVHPL